MKYVALMLLLGILGLIFEIMAFTDPTFSIGSRIFAIVCGLIFLALPAATLGTAVSDVLKKYRNKKAGVGSSDDGEEKTRDKQATVGSSGDEESENGSVAGKESEDGSVAALADGRNGSKINSSAADEEPSPGPDEEPSPSSFVKFRQDFAKFFLTFGSLENTPLQFDTTQIFWHILMLQKKRLDRKGITMNFAVRRKVFPGVEPVAEKSYFDGKYKIREISESVEICKYFLRNGQTFFRQKLGNKLAHFVTLSAEKVGKNKIICPNCGSETTRENLIDGCDYCGTKFTVEDLQDKVSAFRIKDSYELDYGAYKVRRSQYNMKVFWSQFAVYFVITCIVYICMFNDLVETAGNVALAILFVPLTSAIAAGMFAFLGTCLFWFCIFPLIQTRASISYLSKKHLEKLRKSYNLDVQAEANIRQFDPLFSVTAFYSELCNKLACIHFADTKAAASAFFEGTGGPGDGSLAIDANSEKSSKTNGSEADGEPSPGSYQDVVDMTVEEINVIDFKVEGGLQKIRVNVGIENLIDRGNRMQTNRENINLLLVKSAKCKTQAVCGPAILKCKNCGASLALEQGKRCSFCGTELDLKKIDWVIREYNVK